MRLKALLACLLVSSAAPALADEGMWTFDNFPAAQVKTKYGKTSTRVQVIGPMDDAADETFRGVVGRTDYRRR